VSGSGHGLIQVLPRYLSWETEENYENVSVAA